MNDIKVKVLEAIVEDTIGVSGEYIRQLCISNENIVSIGGVQDIDTHIFGEFEGEIIWIEKAGLIKLWDIIKLSLNL